MTEADHCELLAVLKGCQGKVMLSAYRSRLYEDSFPGWACHTRPVVKRSSSKKAKGRETECL